MNAVFPASELLSATSPCHGENTSFAVRTMLLSTKHKAPPHS
jgi:hypothetical protein